MACILQMMQIASTSLLAILGRASDCGVVASPFTVGTTEDVSTLSTSLGCSNGTFVVQWVGEIFVAETIHVTNGTSLSITGIGAGSRAIADGRNDTQLFVVDRGSSLHFFSDMTLAYGDASSFGGATNAPEASVSFNGNASFMPNSAGVHGGAIFANRSTIFWDGDSTEFIFNSARGDLGVGGAISAYSQYESNTSWDSDGTLLISNSAVFGGAIFAEYGS